MKCILTGKYIEQPIFISANELSITSLGQIVSVRNTIFYNEDIDHLYTLGLKDPTKYYDTEYNIGIDTPTDDQLYSLAENNKKTLRSEHQASTVLRILNPPPGSKILEYGCGKALTSRRIAESNKSVEIFLYDISSNYERFWKKFLSSENFCCYNLNEQWKGKFDYIVSFFVLEHVVDPVKVITEMYDFLNENGKVYILVPCVFQNPVDFILTDHLHHYSITSLVFLLNKVGFAVSYYSTTDHHSSLVIVGSKEKNYDQIGVKKNHLFSQKVTELKSYWCSIETKLLAFEEKVKGKPFAIYGAGTYGSYVYSTLLDKENLLCFIDRDPSLHGQNKFDVITLSPNDIPDKTEVIYVALNPKIGLKVINEIDSFKKKSFEFFFI